MPVYASAKISIGGVGLIILNQKEPLIDFLTNLRAYTRLKILIITKIASNGTIVWIAMFVHLIGLSCAWKPHSNSR